MPVRAAPSKLWAVEPPEPTVTVSALSPKLVPSKLAKLAPAGLLASSLTANKVALPLATGASLTAVMLVAKLTVALAYAVVVPWLLTLMLLAFTRPVALLSTRRAVSAPGVPLKLAAGKKRNCVAEARYSAVLSPKAVVDTSTQVVPLAECCHLPWLAVAALPVRATPKRVWPVEPPVPVVTMSVLSEKLASNKLATLAPTGAALSSLTAASKALPLARGASFTAVMLVASATVALE